MYLYCSVKDGYIMSVGKISAYNPEDKGYIREERYTELVEAFQSKPEAPDGYGYHLKEDLTWELYELPPEEAREELTAATEADYQDALREMGVKV